MNWFRNFFAKRDRRLVKSVDARYRVTNTVTKEVEKTDCILTYYLYEDQFSNRKFDLVDSEDGDLDVDDMSQTHWAFRNKIYRDQIKPWIDGRRDPEIPTYESIKAKEMKDILTGRVT